MNSLLEMYAYGMSTKRQIEEYKHGQMVKNSSVRKSSMKELKPVFELTEDDLP